MPIARVRIAPFERWCDEPKSDAAKDPVILKSVGLTVEIDPATMTLEPPDFVPSCGGKWWKVTMQSRIVHGELRGYPSDTDCAGKWICEHMLEMD